MKKILTIAAMALCCAGCANYRVQQNDISQDPDGTSRQITTSIKGTAWFSSAQNISKIKATQTDKTQSFGTDSVGQQGATNTVEVLKALAAIIAALPK